MIPPAVYFVNAHGAYLGGGTFTIPPTVALIMPRFGASLSAGTASVLRMYGFSESGIGMIERLAYQTELPSNPILRFFSLTRLLQQDLPNLRGYGPGLAVPDITLTRGGFLIRAGAGYATTLGREIPVTTQIKLSELASKIRDLGGGCIYVLACAD